MAPRWLSVQSACELFEHQIGIERDELLMAPEEEAQDLAPSIRRKDFPPIQARDLGQQLVQDPRTALDTLAREELGVDPAELGGSAWEAASRPFSSSRPGRSFPSCPIFHRGNNRGHHQPDPECHRAIHHWRGDHGHYRAQCAALRSPPGAFGMVAAAITFGIGRLVGSTFGG